MKSHSLIIEKNPEQLLVSYNQCLSSKTIDISELERLNNLFKRLKSSFTHQQTEQLLYLYSKVRSINIDFVQQALIPLALKHQDNLSLNCQANFSHFLAVQTIYNQEFCEKLVHNFLKSDLLLDPESLIDLQWSLSKHKFYDERFFAKWNSQILEQLPRLSNFNLSKSILAVAKNGYFSPELINSYINECNNRSFNRREAINVAYGLSMLMVNNRYRELQGSIVNLLQQVNVESLKNEVELRQIISAYSALDKSNQDSLTIIQSKLEDWNRKLKNNSEFIVSRPQSSITQHLRKYDRQAQEEVWYPHLATSIDIYLPSISTYVQVDGPRHFYNNRPDLYLAASKFNSEIIQRQNKLLRISNLGTKSYRKVIIDRLNDQFFATQTVANTERFGQETAAAIDTTSSITQSLRSETDILQPILTSKKSLKGKKKQKKTNQEEDFDEILKSFQATNTEKPSLDVEIHNYKEKHKIKKDSKSTLFKHCVENHEFNLANKILSEYSSTISPEYITNFIEYVSDIPNLHLHPEYDNIIELVNKAISLNKVDGATIVRLPNHSAIAQILIDSDYNFNQAFDTISATDKRKSKISIISALCMLGDYNSVKQIVNQGRVDSNLDKELSVSLALVTVYGSNSSSDNNPATLKLLLEHNFSPNLYDPLDFSSPLQHALIQQVTFMRNSQVSLANHFAKIADILIEYGASPLLASDSENISILMCASVVGRIELVEQILENGCPYDIDIVSHTDSRGSPLCEAIINNHNEIAELLIEHGAKIDQPYKDSYTPLIFAAESRNIVGLRILLEKGANVNYTTPEGNTAFDIALSKADINICRALLENGFYNKTCFDRCITTSSAPQSIKDEIHLYRENPVQYILGRQDIDNPTKLRALEALSKAASLPEDIKLRAKNVVDALQNTPAIQSVTPSSHDPHDAGTSRSLSR